VRAARAIHRVRVREADAPPRLYLSPTPGPSFLPLAPLEPTGSSRHRWQMASMQLSPEPQSRAVVHSGFVSWWVKHRCWPLSDAAHETSWLSQRRHSSSVSVGQGVRHTPNTQR